jgi:aconitate hydratase
MKQQRVRLPAKFIVDDAMVVKPKSKQQRQQTKLEKGPNIRGLPKFTPLPDVVNGVVALKVADEVTTDHIMPAGKYLKLRSNVPEYAKHVFEPVDPTFYERVVENRKGGSDSVIVAGLSYGQGSSREHAALCPMYLGVKVIMAKSIERIHRANLINVGILPLVFKSKADYGRVKAGDRLELSDVRRHIRNGEALVVRNITRHTDIAVVCETSERERQILLAGGLLAHVKGMAKLGDKR